MRSPLFISFFAAALVLASTLQSLPAEAKSSRKVSYSYERIWPTTVRFLRVDERLKIIEKDVDTGYVLFELKEEGKRFQGSVEVIRRKDDKKREAVELIVTLQDRPSYMEQSLLDRMLKKVRAELGLPEDPPKDEPTDKPEDTPADAEPNEPKGADA